MPPVISKIVKVFEFRHAGRNNLGYGPRPLLVHSLRHLNLSLIGDANERVAHTEIMQVAILPPHDRLQHAV